MKTALRKVAFVFLFVLIAADGWSGDAENLFFSANQLYANGQYEEALDAYEQLLSSGIEAGPIYYNMGNTYFRLHQNGRALAAYERAKRLMPQDEDLFANMRFLTKLFKEAQPADRKGWNERLFLGVRDLFSASSWFFISLLTYWTMAVLLGLSLLLGRTRKSMLTAAGILCVFFVSSLAFYASRVSYEDHSRLGVVISPEIDVRYSPSYAGAVAFKLHEGIVTEMLGREGEWTQVRLTRNKSGWVESSALEEI